jgi:hypothetical protein
MAWLRDNFGLGIINFKREMFYLRLYKKGGRRQFMYEDDSLGDSKHHRKVPQ